MRKYFVMILALGVVAGLAASSFAASVSKSTFTASVAFAGAGTVNLTASLKNLNGTAATAIGWTGVTIPATDWKNAEQYIEINTVITSTAGLVQIYTDNKGTGANPAFTGAAGTNPVGLVRVEDPTKELKMCWRLTDNTTNSLTIVQGTGGNNQLFSSELGGQAGGYPCFLWMKDASTPNIPSEGTTQFVNGEDYVTVIDGSRGGQHAEGTFAQLPSPNYVYLGAKFQGAMVPGTYRTNKLTVEAFME